MKELELLIVGLVIIVIFMLSSILFRCDRKVEINEPFLLNFDDRRTYPSPRWSRSKCEKYTRSSCEEIMRHPPSSRPSLSLFSNTYRDFNDCMKRNVPLPCRQQMGLGRPYLDDFCDAMGNIKHYDISSEYKGKRNTKEACMNDVNILANPLNEPAYICSKRKPKNIREYAKCYLQQIKKR